MKVLVVGSEGMMGHVVKLYFQEKGHTVKGTVRSDSGDYQYDIANNVGDLEQFIDEFVPNAVINCTGILNKVAEENKSLAVMINSYFPHYADEICRKKNVKFVHVSTDCVFEGSGSGKYTESSVKDATSFYGQSKALGEVNNDSSVTLRTSIVGPDMNENGIGLFQWFMNQSEANGFDKVIWSGVTTIEFAKAMEKAIENNLTGLRHVVNNEEIDKYSLLRLFKKHFNKTTIINRKSDYVSNKSLVRATDYDFEVPSYDRMVEEMKKWVAAHEDIYPTNQRVSK